MNARRAWFVARMLVAAALYALAEHADPELVRRREHGGVTTSRRDRPAGWAWE